MGSSAAVRVLVSGLSLGQVPDEEVLEAVVDLDMDRSAAVRRWKRATPGPAAAGFAVFALALGQDDSIVAIGGQPDDTGDQPSASDTKRSEPSGSQRAPASTLCSPATTRVVPVATSTRVM